MYGGPGESSPQKFLIERDMAIKFFLSLLKDRRAYLHRPFTNRYYLSYFPRYLRAKTTQIRFLYLPIPKHYNENCHVLKSDTF